MGTTADTVRCTMTDPTDGLVYDMTVSLIEELVEPDWYEWFFTPIESKNTAIFKDIPPYLGADIQVTIEGGGTVSCGVCAAGYAFNIGRTNYGLKPGFTSYSVKTQDEFGNNTISVRGNSSLCDYPVEIDGTKFDYVSNMIRSLDSQYAIWIGDELVWLTSIVYGFVVDFSPDADFPNHTKYVLKIQGLL
jgi:hypothetical protein